MDSTSRTFLCGFKLGVQDMLLGSQKGTARTEAIKPDSKL